MEIGGGTFFTRELVAPINEAFLSNGLTPAVIHEIVAKLRKEREAYIGNLKSVRSGFASFGIEVPSQEAPEASFKLPRALFDNDLDGLIDELRALSYIIRTFSEYATGSVSPAVVQEISTSDPLFGFGLDVHTVMALAGAVSWALMTWKQVEQIRKIRADTAQVQAFTHDEVEKFFGDKLRETIQKGVAEKVQEMLPEDGKAGRRAELRNAMTMALESLLARIERGMTVEFVVLPPPEIREGEPQSAKEAKKAKEAEAAFAQYKEIRGTLLFPKADAQPVTRLPRAPAARENGET